MRSKTFGQSPIQTMIGFMVIVTFIVAIGLGGYMWWVKNKQNEENAKAVAEARKQIEVQKEAEYAHKPTENFDVFGFSIPPAYHFTQKPVIAGDGGVAYLQHEATQIIFRLEKKPTPSTSDVDGAMEVYVPKNLSDEVQQRLENLYSEQAKMEYVGLDDIYLSDGTPYRTVAYYENTETPEFGRMAKVYTEFVYPDRSMLEVMAFKPNSETDADIDALIEAIQQFLVETGADGEAVLEAPEAAEAQ